MAVESTEGLTEAQRERRLSVIRAALDLANRGGYEAVAMRDVSTEAGVALGTIYRYFSSKDHLLVAGMVEWQRDLKRVVARRPPKGDTVCDRVLDVLFRALANMDKRPQQAAAVVIAQSSSDPAAARAAAEATEVLYEIVASAFPSPEEADAAHDAIRVLGHVWFSTLVLWTSGSVDIEWVRSEVETAAHLLLPG